jgi:hypothetical protein
MPDDFAVAVGHTYPSSCIRDDDTVIYRSLYVGYDAETRRAAFEVRGESARQLGRLMAGLPFDPTES